MAANLSRSLHWYWIPLRILLGTVLLTLICFAVSTLFGIIGVITGSIIRRTFLDITYAYRYVGFPVASGMLAVALVFVTTIEIRHYRQMKALARTETAN